MLIIPRTGSLIKKRALDSSEAYSHHLGLRQSAQPSARPEGFVGSGDGKRKEAEKEEGDEEEEMEEELEDERDHAGLVDLRASDTMEQRIMDASAPFYPSDRLALPTKGHPWLEYEIEKDINILTWHGPHRDPQLPEFTEAVLPALSTEMQGCTHPSPDRFPGRIGLPFSESTHSTSKYDLENTWN